MEVTASTHCMCTRVPQGKMISTCIFWWSSSSSSLQCCFAPPANFIPWMRTFQVCVIHTYVYIVVKCGLLQLSVWRETFTKVGSHPHCTLQKDYSRVNVLYLRTFLALFSSRPGHVPWCWPSAEEYYCAKNSALPCSSVTVYIWAPGPERHACTLCEVSVERSLFVRTKCATLWRHV